MAMDGMGQDREMDDLRKEVRNVSESNARLEAKYDEGMAAMASSVNKMASSVDRFTEHSIRAEARQERQDEINRSMQNSIDGIGVKVDHITKERDQEKGSRDFLNKYWPWMMVVFSALVALVLAAASGVGRQIVS